MPEGSGIAIPTFYRILFTWIDPIVAIWGAYLDFFEPDMVLNSFIPNSARNPDHDLLFQQLGGGMLNIAFVQAILLRYTNDIKIWKIIQAANLIVDIVMMYSLGAALMHQGRLSPADWRGEDWGCLGITGFATIVRIFFVAEVGFRKRVPEVKKS